MSPNNDAQATAGDGTDHSIQRHRENLRKLRPTNVPVIYHYTSVAAMKEILSRKKLWLSSSLTTNDKSEGTWLQACLTEYEVEAAIKRGTARSLEHEQALRGLQLLAFGFGGPQAYLACFSQNADQLSQWRGYADDGRGVAIGFNPNDGRFPVIANVPRVNVGGGDVTCSLNKVLYTHDIAPWTELVENALSAGLQSAEFTTAQDALSAMRWLTKNPGFSEEAEWRVVNLAMQTPFSNGPELISAIGPRLYRVSGTKLISYFEMSFQPDAVVEMVIGPGCELEESELQLLLIDSGLRDVEVRRSATTYRR